MRQSESFRAGRALRPQPAPCRPALGGRADQPEGLLRDLDPGGPGGIGAPGAEYTNSGARIQEHIWLGDVPVAVISGGGAVFHVLSDHLGTPRQILDSAKCLRWRWDNTDPFGVNAPNQNPQGLGGFGYNLRFPGQYYDAESGLHYNYFRDYDPRLGRYVQSDPIGLEGGMNIYAYVGGNPLSYVDPLGLAKSGQTVKIPGGNPTTVRVDPPHVPGQQTHAHVCEKGCKEIVVNQDGTGSHGSDPKNLKSRVKDFLRKRGFKITVCPPFLEDMVMGVAAEQCAAGDIGMCGIFKQMGGTIEPYYD